MESSLVRTLQATQPKPHPPGDAATSCPASSHCEGCSCSCCSCIHAQVSLCNNRYTSHTLSLRQRSWIRCCSGDCWRLHCTCDPAKQGMSCYVALVRTWACEIPDCLVSSPRAPPLPLSHAMMATRTRTIQGEPSPSPSDPASNTTQTSSAR